LAQLYDSIGEYAKAEPLFQKALRLRQLSLGAEDPDTASALCNLGKLYMDMGEYAKAEPLCLESLRIFRNILGSENPYTAQSLHILANLYKERGEYAKAEPLYLESLQIRQKLFGLDHPDTAISLDELGALHDSTGEYAKAEPLLKQSLPILQKVFGADHQTAADACGDLALVEFDLGRIDEATVLARQEAVARLAILTKICAFGSEEQRLSYFDRFLPFGIFPELQGTGTDLATAVLRYKGVVLNSMIEDRQQVDASMQDKKLVRQLNLDKTELSQLNLEESLATRVLRIGQLEDEITYIEGQFAQQSSGAGRARAALSVAVEQVQSVIPDDSALVEYLRYPRYLGKGKWEQHYGALVLLSKGAPLWIPLGKADGIETLVRQYGALVREAADNDELAGNLEALHEVLWTPVSFALPNQTKRLIISPDGQLNFVSFATLLNKHQQFLTERYDIRYVASGRDLLREPKPPTGKEVVLFANPDFNLPSTGTLTKKITRDDLVALGKKSQQNAPLTANQAMIVANMKLWMSEIYPDPETEKVGAAALGPANKQRDTEEVASTRGEPRDVEGWSFVSLNGTKKEDDELTKKFRRWGWVPTNFTEKDATKKALLKVRSPYILHLATHGFFDKDDPTLIQNQKELAEKVTKSNFFRNPMHRGGLALAGAQTTIEAWKRDEVPPVENDGILTAEEVSTLDLQGTWLVTLSACDTGSGEA
jgi:CHAT domain-containing protein